MSKGDEVYKAFMKVAGSEDLTLSSIRKVFDLGVCTGLDLISAGVTFGAVEAQVKYARPVELFKIGSKVRILNKQNTEWDEGVIVCKDQKSRHWIIRTEDGFGVLLKEGQFTNCLDEAASPVREISILQRRGWYEDRNYLDKEK